MTPQPGGSWTYRLLAASAILLAAVLIGGLLHAGQDDPLAAGGPATGDLAGATGAPADGGCDALTAFLRPIAEREFSRPEEKRIPMSPVRAALLERPVAAAPAAWPGEPQPPATPGPAGQQLDITQVAGTRVVTFGGKSHDGVLRVIDTSSGRLDVIGTLKVDDPQDQSLLLLPRDRALLVNERTVYAEDPAIYPTSRTETVLTLVDLADPAHPAVLRTDRLAGRILDAHERGGVVRLVLAGPPGVTPSARGVTESRERAVERDLAAVRRATGEAWLPTRVTSDAAGRTTYDGPLLGCSDVIVPARPAGLGIASVLTIDSTSDDPAAAAGSVVGLAADAVAAYASGRRVYLAAHEDATGLPDPAATIRAVGSVAVHAFDTTARAGSPHVAAGTAPGLVSGPSAFSEQDGRLRVVLGPDESRSMGGDGTAPDRRGAAVLTEDGPDLRLTGSVLGPATGAGVGSVTWLGDLAVVRSGYDDPDHDVFDLRDPAKPVHAGRLPGWVRDVQPAGDHLLLVRGKPGTVGDAEIGRLRFLDLTRPDAPKASAVGRVAGEVDQRSAPPDSFGWFPGQRLALVALQEFEPVGPPDCPLLNGRPSCSRTRDYEIAVRVDGEGRLQRSGRVEVSGNVRRVLLVGDRILVVGDEALDLVDRTTLRVLDHLSTELPPPPP